MKPEPVGLETLESWLGYIMEREASLSAMISAMRGNLIEARSIISRIEGVFRRLNELSFNGEPMCIEGEAIAYSRMPKIYENYLVRSEALKARLGTVMDSVRTYLSIQQQKLTLEEQKASKEQLVRLVGLQEIFHKVEIFILAVYITEMVRIIFEALAENESTLLTAIFIPVALVMAVGVTRLLHRK
jgi:dGTP triphosphohydrolase